MWNQACSQSPAGVSRHKAALSKKTALQILPCTVSQLLSATRVSSDTFSICDLELNQVSVVGVLRRFSPFVTNIQYFVDDMTGPPLNVKQWVNAEDCAAMTLASPGTYVKVIGNLRSFSGQRSVLAMNIRCVVDLNEITSHMLEVVQAHMLLSGKVFDINMNTSLASLSGQCDDRCPAVVPNDPSTIHDQVLHVIRKFSHPQTGISLEHLWTQLRHLSLIVIRSSLDFLINEGHIFFTIDEQHFKAANPY